MNRSIFLGLALWCSLCSLPLTAGASAGSQATLSATGENTAAVQKAIPAVRPQITAISTVYGDGESVSAVVLRYPKTIDEKRFQAAAFQVEGKAIRAVKTNDRPEVPAVSKEGPYVILELDDPAAPLPTAASQAAHQDTGKEKEAGALAGGDAPMYSDRKAPDLSVAVRQTGTVFGEDGTVYGPWETALAAEKTVYPWK